MKGCKQTHEAAPTDADAHAAAPFRHTSYVLAPLHRLHPTPLFRSRSPFARDSLKFGTPIDRCILCLLSVFHPFRLCCRAVPSPDDCPTNPPPRSCTACRGTDCRSFVKTKTKTAACSTRRHDKIYIGGKFTVRYFAQIVGGREIEEASEGATVNDGVVLPCPWDSSLRQRGRKGTTYRNASMNP